MPKVEQLSLFHDPAELSRVIDAIPANREKLRVDEVCSIFNGCTREHVYNLIYDGSLVAVNIARDPRTRPLYRVLTQSVRDFLRVRLEGCS